MRHHYPTRAVEQPRRVGNAPAILLGTMFTLAAIAGLVVWNPGARPADMARGNPVTEREATVIDGGPTVTTVPLTTSPSPSATAKATRTPTSKASPTAKKATAKATTAPVTKAAPAPQPKRVQTTSAPVQPTYDSCPDGDYSGSRTDGSCGVKTVTQAAPQPKADSCPNGDFSGAKYDGSCGTAPQGVAGVTASVLSCTYDVPSRTMFMTVKVSDPDGRGFTLYTQFGSYGAEPWATTKGTVTYTDKLSNVPSKTTCRAWVG